MDIDTFVPLVLPLLAWPLAHLVVPRLPPRAASRLLTGGGVVLALGSTATLAIQAVSQVLLPASEPLPWAIGCGITLVVLAAAAARTAVRYTRWLRDLNRELDGHHRGPGVLLVSGDEPIAFAAPGRGGRVVVSRGMADALEPRERQALLAHEEAHLRLRHHRFLVAITAATALNPLLRPLGTAARFALERWADKTAARQVGDRKLVATAVAKAALAGPPRSGYVLAATGGRSPGVSRPC